MRLKTFLLLLILAVPGMPGAERQAGPGTPQEEAPAAPAATPYRLGPEDTVRLSVFGEPELSVEQRLDDEGRVRVPLLGERVLSGLTVREAELSLERAFVEARLLRDPQVTVVISSFRPRNALILGQVRVPGNVSFPPNTERIDIVQLVTLAGGFTETARSGSVSVSRRRADGSEETFTVDVASMLDRARGGTTRPEPFMVMPGDRITVPQRIF